MCVAPETVTTSDAEAERAGDPIVDAAILRGDRIELPAVLGAEKSRAEENGEGERDLELARSGTVQSDAPAQRRPRRPLDAQQHPMRGRFEGDAGQRGPRLSPSEHRAQQSHAASSTIQATGSSNEEPAWAVLSGADDVSVGPGRALNPEATGSLSSPAVPIR